MARDRTPLRLRRRRRLLAVAVATLTLGGAALAEIPASAATKPRGHDVSSHQGNVDWSKAKSKGAKFVYVKATESTTYRNPYFAQQYTGSFKAGLLHGAYHFALPHRSSGKTQARYFVKHGGNWSRDGRTLPPAVDLENNPYGSRCYGLSRTRMVSWIRSFSNEVKRKTGRRPVIYTTARWWNDCTGRSKAFGHNHALWLARWGSSPGSLPAGWSYWSFWQRSNSGSLPGDQDTWNGSLKQLKRFARG
ncbi:lysozyme [Streptomyces sp. NPDC004647]|uniref:lysozyme n=1 Tax=Streptomyces sp. NPDC004647 TaxID=3154671 RepID=UPI0033BCA9A5